MGNMIVDSPGRECDRSRWPAASPGGRARTDVTALVGPARRRTRRRFARAFIRSLTGTGEEVPSPTFTLVQTHAIARSGPVWHFDLYRLKEPEEAWELGIEDAFRDGIVLIEWPELIETLRCRPMAAQLTLELAPGDGRRR